MLGFMHWTHRLYPYGPSWLAATVPLSLISFQKLIPIALMIKGLSIGSYLLTSWLIFKILGKLDASKKLLGLVIFAFNPLVVVESLVSAHNDSLMMALMFLGFWLLIEKRPVWAWLSFIISVGVKFATGLLLPVFGLITYSQLRGKKVPWNKIWGLVGD